ncbi:hypothetical protein G6F57_014430 [Rhizopus arrhizus]|nr:hypothetical protein G6F57_014430 [Rhizopus arrhizus]
MWKTGHSLVKAKLAETGAPLAGEMSGHIFFKERWYGFDDGLYTGARLLEIVSRFADACAPLEALPQDVSTPELKLEMEEGQPFTLVQALQDQGQFPDARRVITSDGVRAEPPKRCNASKPTSAANWASSHQKLNCLSESPMSLPNSPAWQQFTTAANTASRRGEQLRLINAPGLRLDLSAQAHSPALHEASTALLAQQGFDAARATLFDGGNANWTEGRAAWHTALRAPQPPAAVAGAVLAERERLREFVREADKADRYGYVLHLGIGGSDWGPRLVTRALRHGGAKREVRFASNVDSHSVADAMSRLDPHDTLVIVASKSFTTTEPLANAEVAMNWLREAGVADPIKQVVAITANVEAALNLGILPDHIFQIWDWVGGRYSLWSAIGLPIALALGTDAFDQLLAGAAAMDEHFRTAPIAENAPVQLALAGVVNRSVLAAGDGVAG